MKRVKRILTAAVIAILTIACTDFKEQEYIPNSISTDELSISFDAETSQRTLVLESGVKWAIGEYPEWLSFKSADNYGSPYRWQVLIEAEANGGYAREGVIVFSTADEYLVVNVFQAGVKGEYVKVTGVTVTENLSLSVGERHNLDYSVVPTNASEKTVSWGTSNDAVVTVSSSGEVYALSTGVAIVTVTTTDGGFTGNCEVTVEPEAVDLGLSVKWASCNLGATEPAGNAFYAWGEKEPKDTYLWNNYAWCKGSSHNLTKYNTDLSFGSVDYKTVLDLSDDAASADWGDDWRLPTRAEWVELMDQTNCTWEWTRLDGVYGYKVKGRKAGYANTIFLPDAGLSNSTSGGFYWSSNLNTDSPDLASAVQFASDYVNMSSVGRNCGLSIRPVFGKFIAISGITLNKSEMDLEVGETATLSATVKPANATDKGLTWVSDKLLVAGVSSDGVVTAKEPGVAAISVIASDGTVKATCIVTVVPATVYVEAVSLDKTELLMTVDETETLSAIVEPNDATDKSVTWSSDKPDVATVSETGVVTAIAAGTATITVTTKDGGKTATCNVSVSPAIVSVQSVSLEKTELDLIVGETAQLAATVLPEDATDKSVTWSSSNTSVATVSSSGVVTAKGAGTCTITATADDVSATCTVTVVEAGNNGTVVSITLPPDDEIWYESHSGSTIPLAEDSPLLVSNTYSNGKGIYKFSKPITEIGGMFDYSYQCGTTKENEDYKSLILPKNITHVGQFGISHLSYATKLVLPYNLSSMGSDCLCGFGEKTPETSNIYFIGETAPSFVSTSLWNMHDLVSDGNKIDNFYYPENNDSYNSLLNITIQGTAIHNWVPIKYSISFAN